MSGADGKALFMETLGSAQVSTSRRKPKLSLSIGEDAPPPARKGRPKLGLALDVDSPPARKGKPKLSLSLGLDTEPPRKKNLGLGLDLGLALSPDFEEEDGTDEEAASLARTAKDMNIVDSEGPANLARDAIKIRALGKGAGGVVYLGLYMPTLKLVAIKEVKVANDKQEEMVSTQYKRHKTPPHLQARICFY
jgi:hypothetical protein